MRNFSQDQTSFKEGQERSPALTEHNALQRQIKINKCQLETVSPSHTRKHNNTLHIYHCGNFCEGLAVLVSVDWS